MKIYTGAGDQGNTSLFNGQRVSKADVIIETYGTIDELNSQLGVVIATIPAMFSTYRQHIQQIQEILFQICAWLATTPNSPQLNALSQISRKKISRLEKRIDDLEEKLPALHQFIVPGGHLSAAQAQLARTVCRRAERLVARLFKIHPDYETSTSYKNCLIFLNRLSDYLFVLSRYLNHVLEVPEVEWTNTDSQ